MSISNSQESFWIEFLFIALSAAQQQGPMASLRQVDPVHATVPFEPGRRKKFFFIENTACEDMHFI